jgi:hypothetical protein
MSKIEGEQLACSPSQSLLLSLPQISIYRQQSWPGQGKEQGECQQDQHELKAAGVDKSAVAQVHQKQRSQHIHRQ